MPQIRARIAAELTSCVVLPDEATMGSFQNTHSSSLQSLCEQSDEKSWDNLQESDKCSWKNLPELLQTVLPQGYTYLIEKMEKYQARQFNGGPTVCSP